MAVSTIDRVRAAETKANEDLISAEEKAEQIKAEADQKAEKLIADAQEKAAAFDDRAVTEARSRAADIVSARRAEAEKTAEALTEKTMKLRQNVINLLIRETLLS